jgi:hypothetical protein
MTEELERARSLLVRPDGHLAWRRHLGSADPRRELESALRAMLHGGESPS